MDTSGSVAAVQATLDKLSNQRDELGDFWATRKLRLDLCLQLRLFERDALEVIQIYKGKITKIFKLRLVEDARVKVKIILRLAGLSKTSNLSS